MRRPMANWILAAAFAAAILAEIWLTPHGQVFGLPIRIAASALALSASGALAFLRTKPEASFWANAAAVVTLVAVGYDSAVYQWSNLLALFFMAAHGRKTHAWMALAAGLGGVTLFFWRFPTTFTDDTLSYLAIYGFATSMWAISWLAGRVYRNSIEQARLATERDLSEERNRIARELHDIVGHTVNVMVVHAGAGRQALASASQAEGSSLQFRTAPRRSPPLKKPAGRPWSNLIGRSAFCDRTRTPNWRQLRPSATWMH